MKLYSILICILIGNFIGCVTTKYSHVNVLEHANKAKKGKYVDKVWVNPNNPIVLSNGKISLGEVNIDSIQDEKGITKQECKEHLSHCILQSKYNQNIEKNQGDAAPGKLKLVITNMSPGDAASRVWAGEFGFGHANVEIQAIIYDSQNTIVMELSDSRNNSGAIGLRDTGHDAGPDLVKELLEQIADDILREINLQIASGKIEK